MVEETQDTVFYNCKELNVDLINPNEECLKNPKIGGSKIIVVGKPNTGKSTLIRDFIYRKSHIIPVGIVVSGTEQPTPFYSKFIHPHFVHYEYNDNDIMDKIKRQLYSIENKISNPWGLILLDDCTEDKTIFNSKLQASIFKNGRHYKLLYILSLQFSTDITPTLRSCVDGIFILRETNEYNLKRIYINYASVIPKFELFKTYMSQITGDFNALYIDNSSQQGEWYEHVYFWKAEKELPKEIDEKGVERDFQFGCFEFIQFGNQRTKLEKDKREFTFGNTKNRKIIWRSPQKA